MKTGRPVILCVGSDRIIGDSIGPLVGELLKNYFKLRCFVYGAPGCSVNGKNLQNYIETVRKAHADSPVIAVDACLSSAHDAGNIEVRRGGVYPKRAVTGAKNAVGDLGILAIIEKPSDSPLSTLLTVSWDNVEKSCYKIAFALYLALRVQFPSD